MALSPNHGNRSAEAARRSCQNGRNPRTKARAGRRLGPGLFDEVADHGGRRLLAAAEAGHAVGNSDSSPRQLFPGAILQRHDLATVAVDHSPQAAFHEPVLAVAFLRAAAADHGPAVLEGKPPVIARRYHDPQLAVDIADLAVDRRSCPPLDEIV